MTGDAKTIYYFTVTRNGIAYIAKQPTKRHYSEEAKCIKFSIPNKFGQVKVFIAPPEVGILTNRFNTNILQTQYSNSHIFKK